MSDHHPHNPTPRDPPGSRPQGPPPSLSSRSFLQGTSLLLLLPPLSPQSSALASTLGHPAGSAQRARAFSWGAGGERLPESKCPKTSKQKDTLEWGSRKRTQPHPSRQSDASTAMQTACQFNIAIHHPVLCRRGVWGGGGGSICRTGEPRLFGLCLRRHCSGVWRSSGQRTRGLAEVVTVLL